MSIPFLKYYTKKRFEVTVNTVPSEESYELMKDHGFGHWSAPPSDYETYRHKLEQRYEESRKVEQEAIDSKGYLLDIQSLPCLSQEDFDGKKHKIEGEENFHSWYETKT
jgi:hypothetical protein